jgi:membrane fusion protein
LSLFRPEVQAAQSAQWLGTVRITRPISFSAVTFAALAIAALLCAFAAWGEVNRKSKVSGLLVAQGGALNITAPVSGVLGELHMAEGSTLPGGAVLAIINTERQSNLVSVAGNGQPAVGPTVNLTVGEPSLLAAQQIALRQQSLATERTLRQLQATQRSQVLTDRISTLALQSRQAEEELALQRSRVGLAQKTVERYTQLASEGFMSDIGLQAKQEELIDTTARLQSLERSRLSLQQDSQALAGERTAISSQLANDSAQIERSQSTLVQESSENATRKSAVVTAPLSAVAKAFAATGASGKAGTAGAPIPQSYRVTAVSVQPGQAVQAGQTIATLVPVSAGQAITLDAHLFAPSRTAGFLKPGQTVYLRYAAYPYQKFGLHTGRITSISDTPFAANELPPNLAQQLMAQNGSNEALFRINVQLDAQSITSYGEAIALKPGLTLEADVLQERRKVWEWALEPLLAARANAKVMTSTN